MRLLALFVATTLAALPACRTEEIGALHPQAMQTSPDQGALVIATSPTPDSLTARMMQGGDYMFVNYVVFVDGRRLVNDRAWPPAATLGDGDLTWFGFIEAGPHHFALADETGGPVRFEGDVVMPAGALTRLYTFGPRDALRGLFVSYPLRPPAGSKHVHLANLVLDDTRFEVVSCDDATHCTAVSPPLAGGETFNANFPIIGGEDGRSSRNASGAGIGFRQVATSTLPTPPVLSLSWDIGNSIPGVFSDAGTEDPANVSWSITILYVGEDGVPSMAH